MICDIAHLTRVGDRWVEVNPVLFLFAGKLSFDIENHSTLHFLRYLEEKNCFYNKFHFLIG